MAANQEKSTKLISKQLRHKANEFLSSKRNSDILVELLNYFESGANQVPCILTLELILTELLKRGDMYQEIVPLKPTDDGPEAQYKTWLKEAYDEAYNKIINCIETGKYSVQNQALITAMKIIAYEGRYPIEPKGDEYYFPLQKLKLLLMKLLLSERNNSNVLEKYHEYAYYNDVIFYTWKVLPPLTPKTHPSEIFVMNFLKLLDAIPLPQNSEGPALCRSEDDAQSFIIDSVSVKRSLNKVWSCVMHWEHTPATHKQLLIVLLERVLPHLDKPLTLTDFLMDSLDAGGPVGLLALQGIFTMMQVHNLDYPNIFTKLYSMFEPEIFHTKFKTRLFYLSDLFLSSTHLPETLVAAFAKRLARLALVAPYEDVVVICMFIGNLIVRHPGLKRLINRPTVDTTTCDPYIMEERDPVKSNAILSSLWEIQTLQSHVLPSIAAAARFINEPIPSVEWDLSEVLGKTSDDMFDKEIKKRSKEIALTFEKPTSLYTTAPCHLTEYWNLI